VGLDARLGRLEARVDAAREEDRAAVSREVLRRMTDEELRAYEAAPRRAKEAVGEFTEEDRPILERAEELYEEVGRELEAPT
jgi:hypothetical protein